MNVYIALLYDNYCGQEVVLGIYDTWDKAIAAINIVRDQRAKKVGEEEPFERFDTDVLEMTMNGFNPNAMWLLCDD